MAMRTGSLTLSPPSWLLSELPSSLLVPLLSSQIKEHVLYILNAESLALWIKPHTLPERSQGNPGPS